MKKLFLTMTLLLSVIIAFGQTLSKEELKAQKKQIKALMNLVKEAEASIIEDPNVALAKLRVPSESPLVNKDPYVWYVIAKAKKAIIDTENNMQLLKQAFDANKLYSTAYEIYGDIALCDSLDKLPNAKNKIAPKYTEELKTMMAECRYILYNGGIHYYSSEDVASAGKYFAKFADLRSYRLLDEVLNNEQDINILNDATFNATMCGMVNEDYNMVLKYVDNLKNDPSRVEYYYDYKARSLAATGDTVAWLAILREGVKEYPANEYFQNSLIQYYNERNMQDELDKLMDEMIANNPTNALYYYVKGYILHNREKYDDAITWYKKAVELKSDYVEAYANMGRCYITKAQDYSNSQASTKITDKAKIKKDNEIIQGYYKEALPYMVKVRELAPDNKSLWMYGLANCYANLNMDKEFEEIRVMMEE